MNEETRNRTTLKATEMPEMSTKIKPFKAVKLPSGKETTNARPSSFKDCPAAYVGKEVNESAAGFAPIYVSWAGSDQWGQNMDQLFFSPEALGIAEPIDGMVRLEQLLWVMDGPLLCEAITGVEWEHYLWEMEDDDNKGGKKGLMFKKQVQLARFFEGQISLFSKMCMGRRSGRQS